MISLTENYINKSKLRYSGGFYEKDISFHHKRSTDISLNYRLGNIIKTNDDDNAPSRIHPGL